MPIQVDLVVNDNQKIVIEFLENPFTEEFITQFKAVCNAYEFTSWNMHVPSLRRRWENSAIINYQQNIIDSITELNSLGLNFPIPVTDIVFKENDSTTRDLLNRLHRCFTTGNLTRNIWEFDTEHTFNLPGNEVNNFNTIVHNINTAVHNIEDYITNDRIESFPHYSEYIVEFLSHQPKDTNDQPTFFNGIKQEHFQYFSDQLDYTVWLPLTQIQGKDYWRGYFDYDDPRQWDISTNVVYSGSLALGTRSGAKAPVLEAWMRSYGIEPGPMQCGMPLGHIIQGIEYLDTLSSVKAIKDVIIQ
ncbi:hypothetical protein UFOVP112_364 [uncultured Caudovirales phage]|uniref:Uncharacterized protein n=1 Tax=uncultured Caudovirales phage TaxID=2100421 RepID=A0A6J5L7R2_9CAUD|nr:hypothetical protein UFOVP112_364 [uncultured Caudovirales phage]